MSGQQTYQGAEVVPDLRDIWVEANGAGVCIQRIPVLVDLVVEHANRAPKRWVASVTINGLLVRLVRFRVLLL